MPKYVDVDVLKALDFQDFSNTDVWTAINDCPAADVVPVVRCRKCQHALCDLDSNVQYCKLRYPLVPTEADSYCSWAEEKEDGDA